ncbi:MAG TPA: FAD-dependent oxidoreductase [Gaiellales bacterium]|nr:FAD-dependent oxidoreductase [Gaiellales bacterium]
MTSTRTSDLGRREYDIVIVGGGVVGCAIARRLSFTTARVALVEAADDVGEGASKGNTGIATSGADCPPGSLEAELVRRSSPGWEALCASLDTPFRRIGALAVALTADEEAALAGLAANARANGCRADILTCEQARGIEPLLAPAVRAAVHVRDDGIVDPLRLTIGFAELAARNGVDMYLDSPVTAFRTCGDRLTHLETPHGAIAAGVVVNAAGIEADTISRLAGGEPFTTWPRQGQYWLLDREIGSRFRTIVGGVPAAATRGVYCVPTTHGSLLLGPTARDGTDRGDRAVDAESLDGVFAAAHALVPSLDRRWAIKTFAANRPASDPEYRVGADRNRANMIHAAGIRSTGVSSSPAVAELVHDALARAGAPVLDERPDAVRALDPVARLCAHADVCELVAVDAAYGDVVCPCEQVSAAEVEAALRMRLPARTVAGLRKRTHAAAGRCQGAMCLGELHRRLESHV